MMWLMDVLIGVYAVCAAIDISFTPGKLATFETGTLSLVIIFLAAFVILSAIYPAFLVHQWVRALERFFGKGVMYILLGAAVYSGVVWWRLIPSIISIALGFAYICFSFCQRQHHPRPLFPVSESQDAPLTSVGPPSSSLQPAKHSGGGGGATTTTTSSKADTEPNGSGAGAVRQPEVNPFLNQPIPGEGEHVGGYN